MCTGHKVPCLLSEPGLWLCLWFAREDLTGVRKGLVPLEPNGFPTEGRPQGSGLPETEQALSGRDGAALIC